MSKIVRLPPKPEKIQRLINWTNVTTVERDGDGVRIFFVDGRSIRDGRSIEAVQELVIKFWPKK